MGARLNLKVAQQLTEKQILRDFERQKERAAAGSSQKSREIQAKLEEYVKTRAPKEKKKVFEFLLKRFKTEGDAFTRLVGYGQYNELVTGILVGVYRTEADILNYKVFDGIAGLKEGDLVYTNNTGIIHGQVKGSGAEFHIPVGTFLFLDREKEETSVLKVGSKVSTKIKTEMLRSAAENFESTIPNTGNFRVLTPIYRNKGTVGVFDMGLVTFKKLMLLRPEMFYFELTAEGKSLSIFMPAKEWVKVVKGQIATPVRKTASGENSLADQEMTQMVLDDILKIDSNQADKKIEEAIHALLYRARVAAWYKYGKIRFTFTNPRSLVEAINPLIATGLMRGDDLKPFLEILRDLYQRGYNRALEEYLTPGETLANKLPEYYYENTYANPNY